MLALLTTLTYIMLDSQASTIADSHHSTPQPHAPSTLLDLSKLPKVFVLPTHLQDVELRAVENDLEAAGAPLAPNIFEASLVLTAVKSPKRAKFELQTRHLEVASLISSESDFLSTQEDSHASNVALGKRKRDDVDQRGIFPWFRGCDDPFERREGQLKIVKAQWLRDSLEHGIALDLSPYLICVATISGHPLHAAKQAPVGSGSGGHGRTSKPVQSQSIDSGPSSEPDPSSQVHTANQRRTTQQARPALLQETTSEHDRRLEPEPGEMPEWVTKGYIYACQRRTPAESPNEDFIDKLKKIRLSRILIEDEIGVRAYSTIIAAIAAYPYELTDPRQVLRLPGCNAKVADIFREYRETGDVSAARAVDEDPALRVINSFYNIWGVGAKTARDFYYRRGWRDHDDIVSHGWGDLSRVQQIGLKYFDEFEHKIPRAEVESIAQAITSHARQLTDERLTCTIVGGYRRGKAESGDVDVVLSHPEEIFTSYLIEKLVSDLQAAELVTYTLMLSETNSQRGQQPLGVRAPDQSRHGLDSLDKALVVWQNPKRSGLDDVQGREDGETPASTAKNPNPHRRVDIIISPWRTVGCAVAGWSSGTTFQRDLRRWARKTRGWKFDSSGVRDRASGRWVDIERWSDPEKRAKTPLEAERRVFEGLGLEYLDPAERCTG